MSEDDDDFSFAEASDRQRLLKPIAGESSKKRTKSDGYGALSSEKLTDWSANEPQLRKKSDASKKAKKWSQVGVFTYATTVDYILLTVGVLASVIHGAGFPLLSIVLGGMTSVFLRAQNSDFVVFDGSENQPTTALTNSSAAITPISRDEFTAQVGQYSIYYLLLGILMFVTSYIQIACFESLAERLVHSIRQHYFAAILRQDISWFDTMQTGSLTARLTDDLERVREGLGDKASLFIQMVAAFASGFVVGLVYSWQMTLVMLIFTPALAYTSSWLGQMMARRTRQELEQYSVAGAIAEETFSSMRTVLSLNGQRQELERYAKALADGRKIGYLKYFSMSMGLGANYIIMFLSYAVAFWFASRLVIWYPEYDRGAVFTVFFAVMSGSTALGAALPNLSSMSSAKGALYYVLKVLNTVPKIDPYSSDGVVLNSISGAIEFSNVHFSYPLRESVKILEGISFSVPAGKKLALVGASGCGKSTIVNMILRFYDPDCGRVTLDGHDLRDLNVKALRDLIGVVSQEPILFDGTLEENIMLGNEYATRDDVNRCCKMANAYNFIHSLPDGLYTRVGERGAQLSGGQKQRIAIARALIKNPRILLLDEATSALDTESEALVQEALDKAQEGRTTIIVAHRLATIRNVDQILVFHQGRIVERGTHEELYALSGIFAEMIDTQQIQRDEARAAATLGTIEDANKTVEAADEGDTNSSDSHNDGAFPATESSPVSNPTPSPAAILRRHKSSSGTPTGYRNITDERVSLLSKKSSIRSISGEPIPGFRKRSNIYGSMSSLSSWRSEAAELREMQYDMAEARLQPTPMRKIFRFNRERWGYFALGMLGCALSGALTPLFALVYSQIVAVFSEPADQLASDAILWSGMFVVLGVLNALGFFISANALGRCGEHLTEKLRYEAFRNLMRQDIAFYDDERHNTGKLCTRFATDTPNVRFVFTRLPSAASALFTLFGAMLVGFINGWRLAIVLLALVPLIIASGYFEMRLRFGKQMRNTKLLEDAGKIASEAVENIRTVAGLNNQLLFHRKYCANLVQPFKTNMLQAQYYAMVFAFSQSLIFFMYALAFFVGSVFVLNGSMTPISVFRVFFAIAFCGQSVGQMSSFIPDVVKARVAASLLFHLIEYPTAIDSLSDLGISMNIRGDIELRNVKFAYPTRRHVCVLNGINLDVRAGQTFALVGYSGCGKSTIIALLERFYNPRRGHLIVDGVNIADYNIHRLREQICLVSQEPILFNTTIAGNICYGLEATADELAAGGGGFSSGKYPATYEQIVEAAEEANIHTFVLGLPDGYETMVGEKGVQLSGGQKQRIAIARALIRRPTVLLLDEATSALDTESERVVQEALENARKGRTCIVIAHRLSTIQNADQIAVINDGRVVQKGTHEELLQQDGIYKSLCQTQILATADATTQQEQRTSAADVQ